VARISGIASLLAGGGSTRAPSEPDVVVLDWRGVAFRSPSRTPPSCRLAEPHLDRLAGHPGAEGFCRSSWRRESSLEIRSGGRRGVGGEAFAEAALQDGLGWEQGRIYSPRDRFADVHPPVAGRAAS
jgi:hypothetical protein